MKTIELNKKTILMTGFAGFIGANLAGTLLSRYQEITIIGVDNLNDYYDIGIKEYRLKCIDSIKKADGSSFKFYKQDIADKKALLSLFRQYSPDIVVNLAAQAGVRYSITNPDVYISSNVIGFYNVLEACRELGEKLEHLVYASSSSVYGGNTKVPFEESDFVDHPVSLYAATKKSNELFAHSYSKLYAIPSTGLRFFTVYGPAGRPDMAYFSFTNQLVNNEKIKIFNYGNCKRDFTYIDDIVHGVIEVIKQPPDKGIGEDGLPLPPYNIYNIGNSHPEDLLAFVRILSEELVDAEVLPKNFDFEAHKEFIPMQPGDVPVTYADIGKLEKNFNFKPETTLRTGLKNFARWYREYYKCFVH